MRRLPWATAGLALVALSVGAVLMASWHQAPWQPAPDRISICGRDFSGPGDHYARQDLIAARRLGAVWTWQGKREVWGQRVRLLGAEGCGTGVYLRTGNDSFRGYSLQGGP